MALFKVFKSEMMPEGIQVLKITACDYDVEWGTIKVTVENKTGHKAFETFRTLNAQGEPNTGAINSFSYLAKTALNNFDLDEFDTDNLVGKYFRCDVGRRSYVDKSGNQREAVALGEKSPASSFDDNSTEIFDLDALLDDD